MKKSEFLDMVVDELNHLNETLTKEERNRLNEEVFSHSHSERCIYGQITGDCFSRRAKRLQEKVFDDIVKGRYLEEGDKCTFKEQDFSSGNFFTPLEKYLYMASKATTKKIISFLKGETKEVTIS